MTNYSVECACGESNAVAQSQAGSTISCSCGQSLEVPRLSELRQSAGEQAYESGIMDVIQRKVASGELPSNDICLVSGLPTKDILWVNVECERKWFRGRDESKWGIPLRRLQRFLLF